ncbi:MAG: TauD/TfdA family dioxygenase [Methylotetracoccus sp.]
MSDTAYVPPLRSARRRPIQVAPGHLVTAEGWPDVGSLPLLVRPKLDGLRLREWAEGQRQQVDAWLNEYAVVLFRGFAVNGVEDFGQCVDALAGGALEYRFRASPRTEVAHHIYTATDYPADQAIFPHNEHAYSPVCPLVLAFFADVVPLRGGATPIGDNRAVMARIDPALRDRFLRKGILYVRNYGAGFGLPWRTVFQTEDRAEVERYCESIGVHCEWKSGDRLCTRQVGPAMVRHPRTGEEIWFNHGTFFHVTSLPETIRDALLAEFAEDDLPQNTYYGDGERIEPEVLEHLRAAYTASMVRFAWQPGDVMLVDNVLAVHAREPFSGYRRVLVAMAQTFRVAEYAVATSQSQDSV